MYVLIKFPQNSLSGWDSSHFSQNCSRISITKLYFLMTTVFYVVWLFKNLKFFVIDTISQQNCDIALIKYRVAQKSWCQVARKVQPGYSQPRLAMPGWCLTKQSLFYAQRCIKSMQPPLLCTLSMNLLLHILWMAPNSAKWLSHLKHALVLRLGINFAVNCTPNRSPPPSKAIPRTEVGQIPLYSRSLPGIHASTKSVWRPRRGQVRPTTIHTACCIIIRLPWHVAVTSTTFTGGRREQPCEEVSDCRI